MDGIPPVHDSPEKIQLLSSVEVFQVDCGDWTRQVTSGTPTGVRVKSLHGGGGCPVTLGELHSPAGGDDIISHYY